MFDKHLKESETTYFAHLIWAVKAGFILIFTGIVSIIHGLIPNFASEQINIKYKEISQNRHYISKYKVLNYEDFLTGVKLDQEMLRDYFRNYV